MRFVIQRVLESEVKVDGESLGKIGKGFMVLIGVSDSDTKEVADKMVKKMLGLRIFEDEQGKTNLSLESVDGELLLISQFTLYANCKRGNRPSFIEAGAPDMASLILTAIVYGKSCQWRAMRVTTRVKVYCILSFCCRI